MIWNANIEKRSLDDAKDAGVDVRERPVAVLASPDEQLGDAGLDFDVYVAYLRAVGVWLTPAIGVALLAMQVTP